MYERAACVAPMVGAGTLADPKRPMYAPAPAAITLEQRKEAGIDVAPEVTG